MLPSSVDFIAFDTNNGGRREDVAASVTGRVSVDGGAWTQLSGSAEHQGNGVYRITLTTDERVAADQWTFDAQSSTASVDLLPAPVGENQALIAPGATIELISPYSVPHKRLVLVQRCDYTDASAIGPVRIAISLTNVTAGDEVRFGASLPTGETIQATGEVVETNGEFNAVIQLPKALTDREPSPYWKWELEHVTASGDVSPIVIDAAMTLHPSYAEPAS
ncbi:MAG: hypothetical protein AAFX06_28800 [Planctomycetota bacterium]